MATKAKSNTTKKTVKKVEEPKNEIVETIVDNSFEEETENGIIDATEVGADIEKIEEALETVDTNIDETQIETEIKEKLDEAFSDVNEISEKIKDLEESKETLGKAIEKEPDRAKEIIENEIKKAEALKAEVQKRINSAKPRGITTWWNGMGYDM